MKNHIQIGTFTANGQPAEFNIAKLILTRLLICANSGGELAIFEYALTRGEVVNDDALEQATGYKQTSRKEYIRLLRARHVLIEAGRGRYRLSEVFNATV